MKITIQLAKDCAQALCKSKRDEIAKEYAELGVRVREEYMKHVPALVKECFEKHRSFVPDTDKIFLGDRYHFRVPVDSVPRRENYDARLSDGKELAFIGGSQTLEARLHKLNDFQERLERTIKALGTSAKVIEAFPELADMLKEDERKQRLPVNVAELRKSMQEI